MERVMIISSDSHVCPPMKDFRPYIESEYVDEFDRFLVEYERTGARNFEPKALSQRLDMDEVDRWTREIIDTGRLEGARDPKARLEQLAFEGIAGDVLFPDFGRPFELYSPHLASVMNHQSREDLDAAGTRAYNRWLADFVSESSARSVAMAPTTNWEDVDATITQLRWFKEAGFKGIVLPMFSLDYPLYHPQFDAIWSEIEDLELIVNSHGGMSSTSNAPMRTPGAPHPGLAARLYFPEAAFFVHNLLSHLIWGAVLERHPRLTIVFTEQGSGWLIPYLEDMDYGYEGSYLRRDLREFLPEKPSYYFDRQCYVGASLFSRAEVDARHEIGLEKMMIGMDYPHHEGTIAHGTLNYLRATFGALDVPENEARMLLGETAAELYEFDLPKVRAAANEVGPLMSEILTPLDTDLYERGDVNKPLLGGFS